MEYPLMWGIILIFLAIALVVMEAFIPSWGVLGTCAVISACAGIYFAFDSGPVHGVSVLLGSLVVFPVLGYLMFKYWPHTPVGKRVLLRAPSSEEVLPDTPQMRSLRELVGKLGRAKAVMLPSGPVEIEGRTVDAVSEGMAIEAGQVIKVIEVKGNRVVVRAVEEELPSEPSSDSPQDDLLSRPLDELGLDEPFEES